MTDVIDPQAFPRGRMPFLVLVPTSCGWPVTWLGSPYCTAATTGGYVSGGSRKMGEGSIPFDKIEASNADVVVKPISLVPHKTSPTI